MNQKGHTPDERFLIKLYELSNALGDPFRTIESAQIAKAIGYKEIAVKNIVKLLAQANFITKIGDKAVRLTENGRRFVLNELK